MSMKVDIDDSSLPHGKPSVPPNKRHQTALLIRKLVEAAIEDANKGGGHPEDFQIIEQDLRQAEMDLRVMLDEVFPGTKPAHGRKF